MTNTDRPTLALEYRCADRWFAERDALSGQVRKLREALVALLPLSDREDVADTWSDDFDRARAALKETEAPK